MNRIFYIVQKEFRQVFRDRNYLRIILLMPIIQIVVLGYAITTDVTHIPVTVVDYDHSQMSRRLVDALDKNMTFDFEGMAASTKSAIRLMDYGKVKLALILPENFERDLINGEKPSVQAIIDGVDGNSAGVILAYVNQLARNLQQEWLGKSPVLIRQISKAHITSIETRMWYNASLESKNNIVPGIIATLLTMITTLVTGMSIVREKEIGTLEQLLVTPIRSGELMLGKILPFLVIGFMLVNVSILAAGLIFGLWPVGSIWNLYVMSFIFSLGTLGVGIFVSTISNTQQQALFAAWFFMIFTIMLSGFFIPIQNMPHIIQDITYLNPLRYFMSVIREIYLKGTPLFYMWKEAAAMFLFGLVTFVLSALRFHKRLS